MLFFLVGHSLKRLTVGIDGKVSIYCLYSTEKIPSIVILKLKYGKGPIGFSIYCVIHVIAWKIEDHLSPA
jgi:hypothetical protein